MPRPWPCTPTWTIPWGGVAGRRTGPYICYTPNLTSFFARSPTYTHSLYIYIRTSAWDAVFYSRLQVVSADSEGFVKTWDLGTYQMIQSFMVDEVTILRAFVSIPSSKRVIVVDREPPDTHLEARKSLYRL